MTANSQLISGKGLSGCVKRGFTVCLSDSLLRFLAVDRANGNLGKRIFDIVFSTFVLVFFSPVYLVLGLLVFISSPGPIFYFQERVGKNRKLFKCIKFRTMVPNADRVLEEMMAASPQLREEFEDNFKLKHDPRITWIGRFLRLTSLDEFPQFWNVLKGDMSVVGPRPLVVEELPKYGRYMDKVLTIRPGITGLWQVSGRNDIPYEKRVKIDVYYVNAHNIWMDLWIAIETIGVIVFPKNNGAY
ncbi:MAG: sugar transferase [Cyanobacteria bacterium SID2]|nr:sugar transferase [Cyanobacteria bacterium SID2]MBP0004442.1 sugar transferase [Cyanobacteria bacterium SBC]